MKYSFCVVRVIDPTTHNVKFVTGASKEKLEQILKMGIYMDTSVIYGVRILKANDDGDYFTHQEFANGHWKEGARQALLAYEEHPTKKVQVLYSCQTTYAEKPFLLWIDNTRSLAELLLLLT